MLGGTGSGSRPQQRYGIVDKIINITRPFFG
jgi:hypothetical protein